jgi:hypothetical protein
MDPALLTGLLSMSADPLLPQTGEGNDSTIPPPFELDENAMRSLQQFIDAQGFQSPPNQSTDEQVLFYLELSNLSSLPLSQE